MFPELIRIRILADGRPLAGALASVHVPMKVKNGFTFIAGPTDAEGRCTVTREQLLTQARADREFFIMDYADAESQNGGYLMVTPMTRGDIAPALSAFETYFPNYPYPEGYIDALRRADQTLVATNPHNLDSETEEIGGAIAVYATSTVAG